jgi:hypothetical protein
MAMVVVRGRNLSIGMADALFANYQTFYTKWQYIYNRYIRKCDSRNLANYYVAEMQKIHQNL